MRTCFPVTLASGVLLIPASLAADSEEKVTMGDLPVAVQQAVTEQSKGATIRGLTKEIENGKTEYEVELTVNGHGKDISFDVAGGIVGVRRPLSAKPTSQAEWSI